MPFAQHTPQESLNQFSDQQVFLQYFTTSSTFSNRGLIPRKIRRNPLLTG